MDDLLGEPSLGCFSSGRQLCGHLELTHWVLSVVESWVRVCVPQTLPSPWA